MWGWLSRLRVSPWSDDFRAGLPRSLHRCSAPRKRAQASSGCCAFERGLHNPILRRRTRRIADIRKAVGPSVVRRCLPPLTLQISNCFPASFTTAPG